MEPNKEIWDTKGPESTRIYTRTGWKYEIGGQCTQFHCIQVVKKNGRNNSHMQPDVADHLEHSMDINDIKT